MLMRSKKISCMLPVLLGMFLLLSAAAVQAEQKTPGQILVVYPETQDRRLSDDSLAGIAQVLLQLGYTSDFLREKEELPLQEYEQVIWVNTESDTPMNTSLLNDYNGKLLVLGGLTEGTFFGAEIICPEEIREEKAGAAVYSFYDGIEFSSSVPLWSMGEIVNPDYTGGLLQIGQYHYPLVSSSGDLRYIALTDYTTEFAKAVLMQEIANWLWPYTSRMHTYTQYVVLDEVYPFSDIYRLKEVVEYMVDHKMNFVISVMPIYDHADYPAMNRFCELLRYAQANGGAVILHSPIIQNGLDKDELEEMLTITTEHYFDNNVYPLGLQVPSEWLFVDELREVMGRYRTIFVSEMNGFAEHTPAEYGIQSLINMGNLRVTPAFHLDDTGISHLGCAAAAVYLPFSELTDEELLASVDAVSNSPLPMQSLWDMEQAVYVNEGYYLLWDKSNLVVNDETRANIYVPEPEPEDFDYKRNVYYRFVANISNQNHTLIGISIVVLLLFLLLMIRSRRQMHRRFLYKKKEQDDK